MRIRIILAGIVLLGIGVFGYQQITLEQRVAREYADALASADRQEWQQAVTSFEAVVKDRPGYRDSASRIEAARKELHLVQLYDAALSRYRSGLWPEAVAQLESLAVEAPNYKDVDARLADAQRQLALQRQYENATARLAARDFPGAIQELQAVGASDYSNATQARADLVQAHLSYADALVVDAAAAERVNNWSAVEQLARQALQQNPQVPAAQRLLGHGLSKRGRYPEARLVLASATERDPKDAQALNLLGWAHLNGSGGDQLLADRAFRQAIQLDPHLANALAGLGGVQLDRGQRDEAQATFQQALALDPLEPAAHQGLGLLALDQEDYAAAEVQFRAAIQQEPEEVVFHLDLTRALLGQQAFESAKAEVDRSKQLDAANPDVDAALGHYYRLTHQYDEAVTAFETAIGLRPDRADFHVDRGAVLLDMNRAQEALEEGDRAVELGEPSSGQVLRAYALVQLRQLDDARVAARLALDADPTNADAQDLLKALAR